MNPVDSSRWSEVEKFYHAALEREAPERNAFLEQNCPDEGIRWEVQSLLRHQPDSDQLLEDVPWYEAFRPPQAFASGAVSHYRLIERIGQGGMGVVYKAEDTKLRRFVALKFLPEGRYRDAAALTRFRREARAASALDHPNICTIYEIGEEDGEPFIAMQFLEGQTVKEAIAGKALDIPRLLDIAIQIADALEAAHQAGIIHRDIKPANLFLTSRGQVKILDFGIAKLRVQAGRAPAVADSGATAQAGLVDITSTSLASGHTTSPGALIGTVAYMSPEQVRGEKLDARTDLFSFGAVLYEMAAGELPFQGESPRLICDAILSATPAPARRINADVPTALETIIGKALEKDREHRYWSAAEIGADLRKIGQSAGRMTSLRYATLLFALTMLIAGAAVVSLFVGRQTENQPKVVEHQITANPNENWVSGAAISPDGKTVAYHDQTGLYLRAIDTGEVHGVSLPQLFSDRMLNLNWFPDGKKLLAPVFNEGSYIWYPDMWAISTASDEAPGLLYRRALEASVSPDGRYVVFLGERGKHFGVYIAGVNGGPERMLREKGDSEWIFNTAWSPDGRWIAYWRGWLESGNIVGSIVVQPAAGGPAKTVLTDKSLPATLALCHDRFGNLCLAWSSDWRLVFTATPPFNYNLPSTDAEFSLWYVRLRPSTAEPAGKPVRLAHWRDVGPLSPTISADGKRLLFMKTGGWMDVYLTELTSEKTIKGAPRRFTLDNRGSFPNGWTPDSKAILFSSDRTARRAILKQSLKETMGQVVIQFPDDDCEDAVFTPDRFWILFRETKRMLFREKVSRDRLMRRPASGGHAETILDEPHEMQWSYACGVKPGSRCILSQLEGTDVVFYSLNPLRGKGGKLGQFSHLVDFLGHSGWSLSPDGSRIAYVTQQGQIEIMSLGDRSWHEIPLPPQWRYLQTVAWAADGNGLFVTCWLPDSSDLIYVTLSGKTTRLLHNGHNQWQSVANPLPSPDGKYLAFQSQTWDSNVWMLENF